MLFLNRGLGVVEELGLFVVFFEFVGVEAGFDGFGLDGWVGDECFIGRFVFGGNGVEAVGPVVYGAL